MGPDPDQRPSSSGGDGGLPGVTGGRTPGSQTLPYRAEIDTVDADQWHRLLLDFDDANIFQTWTFGAAHWGETNLSHAVIKHGDEVVGLAQSVLIGVPLLGKILAYVIFGPVCQRRGAAPGIEHWQATLAALREEYTVRRRLCLRLRWWGHDVPDEVRAAILADAAWEAARPLYTTYILDLSRSERQLRAAMDKKWRANLRKAERSGLAVSQRNDHDGIRIFVELYRQMGQRKRFTSPFAGMLPALYRQLPEALQPRLFVCWRGTVPVAAAVVSALGIRAFLLNSAIGDAALEVRAGHFLQWTIVRWLKEAGRYRWYDLYLGTAIPGRRRFKRGLVGARAAEVATTEIEARARPLPAWIVRVGSRLHELRRQLKGTRAWRRPRTPVRQRGSVARLRSAADAPSRARASR
jgi:Acetyltransferase (GNAT) domain